MKKSRDALFYAEKLPSGFYALYANGEQEWRDASLNSIDSVRRIVDIIAKNSKLTCYTLTFSKEEYDYMLSLG